MKKVFVLFMLCSSIVFSQNFEGKAIYKTHRKFDVKINNSKHAPNSAIQKQIHEQLKRQFQKTFSLQFTKSESLYKEEKQLAAPNPQTQNSSIQITISSSSDFLYKNVVKGMYKSETEINGKRFLIEDNLPVENWELTNETKKIGNYTCYKAQKTKEVVKKSYLTTDGELEETQKKEKLLTIAWYTPQIPVSNGPKMFGGLPGLILEISEGKQTIICSEIVLNPKEKTTIKIPKRGKKVSQKEFDEIQDKQTAEMFLRFQNQRKSKRSNVIQISN